MKVRRIALAVVAISVLVGGSGKDSRAQIPGLPTGWPVPIPGMPVPPAPGPVATGGALYPRGAEHLDVSTYLKIAEAFVPAMGNLPPSADLSAAFPPVGDQGAQSSCTAWSVAYALKSFQEHEERGWAYTTDHLFSPAFVYNSLKKSPLCKTGLNIKNALDFVASEGVAPLSLMPYSSSDCGAVPSESAKAVAKAYRVTSIKRVPNDIVEIKGHLVTRTPVVVGMNIDDSFDYLKGSQIYGGPKGPFGDSGHAMVIVGFDDSRQAFRLFNSWGKTWGDGGVGWVSYTALVKQAFELYVAKDFNAVAPPGPSPTPTPTPTPAPSPVAAAPKATLTAPSTMKNILVGDSYYFGLSVSGKLQNAINRKLELVVRFKRAGAPIPSKDAKYRDAHGDLAAGTPKQLITKADFDLNGAPSIALPQLTLKQSLGSVSGDQVEVEVYYDAYVDGFHVARSPSAKVTFKWN